LGGGAKGFNRNKEIVGHLQADWRCIGGVDVDAGALRDFQRLAGVPGTQMDLFTREQYIRFQYAIHKPHLPYSRGMESGIQVGFMLHLSSYPK
jgi:hypothetical protein